MLAKNKEHSARSKGDRRLCFESRSCVLLRKPFPRSSPLVIKYYGAAIEGLITKISGSLASTLQLIGELRSPAFGSSAGEPDLQSQD